MPDNWTIEDAPTNGWTIEDAPQAQEPSAILMPDLPGFKGGVPVSGSGATPTTIPSPVPATSGWTLEDAPATTAPIAAPARPKNKSVKDIYEEHLRNANNDVYSQHVVDGKPVGNPDLVAKDERTDRVGISDQQAVQNAYLERDIRDLAGRKNYNLKQSTNYIMTHPAYADSLRKAGVTAADIEYALKYYRNGGVQPINFIAATSVNDEANPITVIGDTSQAPGFDPRKEVADAVVGVGRGFVNAGSEALDNIGLTGDRLFTKLSGDKDKAAAADQAQYDAALARARAAADPNTALTEDSNYFNPSGVGRKVGEFVGSNAALLPAFLGDPELSILGDTLPITDVHKMAVLQALTTPANSKEEVAGNLLLGGAMGALGDTIHGIRGTERPPTSIHDVTGEVPYTPRVDAPTYDLPFKTPTQKAAAIAQHIDTLTSDWQSAPEFTVYKSKAALAKANPELWGALQRDGATRAPGFFGEDGKVHIIAENVKDPAKISSLLYHEALGHAGMQEQFQAGLDDVLQNLYDTNHRVRSYADAYNAKYGVYTGPDAHLRASEEYLARQSENGPLTKSLMDKVVSYIRDFGRKNLGMDLRYTDREVRAILADAHSSIINGKPEGIADPYGTAGNRYMYAGSNADHAGPVRDDHFEAMNRADNGEDTGPGSQVHRDTGWFFNSPDRRWRKEISDAPIEDREGNLVEGADHTRGFVDKYYQGQGKGFVEHPPLPLPKVLDHPELYKLYPELRNVTVRSDASVGTDGSISGNTIKIAPDAPDHLGTLLHEVQHWIQNKEGFAKGGNLQTGIKNMTPEHLGIVSRRVEKYYEDRINKYTDGGKKEPSSLMAPFVEHWKGELKNLRRNLNSDDSVVSVEEARKQLASVAHLDRQAYDHLFGEVEARDTTNRKGLSPDQRKNVTPYTSEDSYIEPKDYIVRYMMPDEGKGNFNVDSVSTSEDIRDYIKHVSEAVHVSETQSHEDTLRLAELTGMTPSKLKKINPELAKPENIVAAKGLLESTTQKVLDDMDKGDPIRLRDAIIKQAAVQEWISQASTNVGRALNALKIHAGKLGVEDALRELDLGRLSDPKYMAEVAELLKNNRDNPAAVSKVARDAANKFLPEDWLTQYHYASMLSGWGSLKHNIVGHIAGNILNNIETAFAGVAGSVTKRLGYHDPDMITLSEMKYRMFGYLNALSDYGMWKDTARSFKTGTIKDDGGNATWSKGPRLPKALTLQENLHSASYTFFGEIEKAANLYALAAREAKAEGLKGARLADRIQEILDKPSKEMMATAMRDANVTRFMGEHSGLGKMLTAAAAQPKPDEWGRRFFRFVVQNLFPFPGIADNKLMSVIRRTPLAALRIDPYTMAEWKSGIAGRQRVISRVVLGTAMMAYAWNELEKHPIDFENGKMFGLKTKDLVAEVPILNLMHLVDQVKKKQKSNDDIGYINQVVGTIGAISKSMQDETYLKSIGDYFSATSDKNKAAADRYWARQLQSWVPESAALREITGVIDPIKRDTSGNGFAETAVNTAKSIIPGLSETLPERRTKLGQTVTSEPTQDAVEQEIQRLEGDKGTPIFLPKSQTEMEKQLKRKVSRREVQDYNKELGGNIHDNLQEWIKSPEWKTMSDADKIQTVKDVVKYWRGVKNASTAQEATGNDQWSVSQ